MSTQQSAIESIRHLLNTRRYLTDDRVTLEPRFHWQGNEISSNQALHVINQLVHEQKTHVYRVKYTKTGSTNVLCQDIDAPSKNHARGWIRTENPDATIVEVKRLKK